jgi:hypothetical protein
MDPARIPSIRQEGASAGGDADATATDTDVEKNEQNDDRGHLQNSPSTSSKHSLTRDSAYKVVFDANDPLDPRNFSNIRKACVTVQLGFLALVGSIGSSIISPSIPDISLYTGLSQEVNVLVVALYGKHT